MIAMGSPTVLIGGLMAARMGDPTEHGGVIVLGDFTVMIGDVGMGGAASGMGMGMASAVTSAVAGCSQNPSHYAKPASPSALPTIPPSLAPPKNALSASQQAQKHTGAADASGEKPPAGLPPVKKEKEIVCGIKDGSIVVTCQHGARKPKDGLLQVVPSLVGGDTIHCNSSLIGSCGEHPVWEIVSPVADTKRIGASTSFDARAVVQEVAGDMVSGEVADVFGLPVWMGDIAPYEYDLSISACSGPSYSCTIQAYPNQKQQLSFSTDKLQVVFGHFKEALEDFLATLVPPNCKPKIELLVGSGQANMQWKEDNKSNLAFYSWAVSLGLNPLISGSFRLPVTPPVVPPLLSDFANAGIFIEFKGEFSFQIDGGRLALPDPPDKPDPLAEYVDVKSENSVNVSLVISVFVGDEDTAFLSAESYLQTGIEADITGKIVQHRLQVSMEFKLGGLKGVVKCQGVANFWGVHLDKEYTKEITFFDQVPLGEPLEFYPCGKPVGEP
jgi:hypothetical protein